MSKMTGEETNKHSTIKGIPANFKEIIKSYEKKIVDLQENNKALLEQVIELQSEQKTSEEELKNLSEYAEEISKMMTKPGAWSRATTSLTNWFRGTKEPQSDPAIANEESKENNNKTN